MSEEDKYKLKIFQMHLGRLSKFTRPLYKKSGFTAKLSQKKSSLKTRNLPTELRMAAIINEIRSFMLNDDPANFNVVANIVSRHYQADQKKVEKIREWKKQWKDLFTQKTQVAINVDGKEILSTWGEILDVLTYGKFVHNEKDKHKTYSFIETDPMLLGHMSLTFRTIAVNIDKFLRAFNHHFIKPILEAQNDKP